MPSGSEHLTIADLVFVAGSWSGKGRAIYPTIEPMDYREELRVDSNGFDPVLHYEQRTWVLSEGDRQGQPIFWESGFFVDRGGSRFELVSAQRTGRMEVLSGTGRRDMAGNVVLSLEHIMIVNDERIVRSGRLFTFRSDSISYELTMSTTAHAGYERHLIAQLHRQPARS